MLRNLPLMEEYSTNLIKCEYVPSFSLIVEWKKKGEKNKKKRKVFLTTFRFSEERTRALEKYYLAKNIYIYIYIKWKNGGKSSFIARNRRMNGKLYNEMENWPVDQASPLPDKCGEVVHTVRWFSQAHAKNFGTNHSFQGLRACEQYSSPSL